MKIAARLPTFGTASLRWIFEGVLIVVSVLLAFAVDDYRESRANRQLATRVLSGLKTEIEHNLATLEPSVAMHRRWLGALNRWLETEHKTPQPEDTSALNVFIATWPGFDPSNISPPFPALQRGAWEAALSTGALRVIDYEVVARLSEIYQWQASLASAVEAMPYSSTAFFDRSSRAASVRQLAFQINAIQLTEDFLLSAYRRNLPEVASALAASR